MSQPLTAVILSTFPPLHCGIGRYAAQQAEYLRRRGDTVLTVGLPGSDADAVVDARGGRNPLRVVDAVRQVGLDPRSCVLYIHWHDEHYFAGGFSERIPTARALAELFRSFGETELICHEVYPPQQVHSPARKVLRGMYAAARRRAWRTATRIAFHSVQEREQAEAALGGPISDDRVLIRDHNAFLLRYRDVDRDTARQELGVAADVTLFLCIGFLSEHKGFHLAMEAMCEIENPDVRLVVVGSIREDSERDHIYVERLRELASHDDRIEFREAFLPDEEYDTWNAAADVVVAPYLRAFSSSVVARAKLFGKRVIVTDIGGLAEQVGEGDIVVRSGDELAEAMRGMADALSAHR